MAKDEGGEKTEKATPKALRDARRRGDVAKSRDLGLAVGLAVLLVVLWRLLLLVPERLASLANAALAAAAGGDFRAALAAVGGEALDAALLLSALVLVPIALAGLLVEFLQTGPVVTAEKLLPKWSNLDPVAGFKRMFGADNLVEFAKSVAHVALLLGIGAYVIGSHLPDLLLLTQGPPLALAGAMLRCALELFAWTLGLFALVTALDVAWQRHSFDKKMRMSQRDIREERKRDEGDPKLKGQRKRLAREWSRDGAKRAASKASVLIVNPVHVAVAVRYDERDAPVPTVTGRGEEEAAREMRDAAEAAEVPILRNETLARALLRDTEDGDLVPRELFGIVAEVTLWALRTRERIERERRGETATDGPELPVPGEDLTRYPGAV